MIEILSYTIITCEELICLQQLIVFLFVPMAMFRQAVFFGDRSPKIPA